MIKAEYLRSVNSIVGLKSILIVMLFSVMSFICSAGNDAVQLKVFELKWKVASEVIGHVEAMLSMDGSAVAEPRSNKIIIWERTSRLWDIERYIAKIDRNDLIDEGSGNFKRDIVLEGFINNNNGIQISDFQVLTPPGFEVVHSEVADIPYTENSKTEVRHIESGIKLWLKTEPLNDGDYDLRAKLWVADAAGTREDGKPILSEFTGMANARLTPGKMKDIEFKRGDKVAFICRIACRPFKTEIITLESLL